ncbi:MAG: PAS domain S-box-containing protein [Paraglaciecola sp.]|jgi:PAS domain S-box-containing protein
MTKRTTKAELDLLRTAEESNLRNEVKLQVNSVEELHKLNEELRTHQIELEVQNEELRDTQEQLNVSKARYFDLYDLAPIGYLTLNNKRLIQECNLAAAKFFGVSRSEILMQPISRFLQPEDQNIFYNNLNICLQSAISQEFETRLVRLDGTVFWAHLHATAAKEAEYWLTLNDISERKQAELEYNILAQQLRQAQKMEAVGHLAGGIAHDFNNMLGIILGNAELALIKLPPSNPLISNLEGILKASKHSIELTRKLLTFARKQTIAPKVLNLNESLAPMMTMLKQLIGENIQLSFSLEPNLWAVKVDSAQIDQILANLCINARDAISGTGKVTIKTANYHSDGSYDATRPYVLESGEYVQLSVRDNGCGIENSVIEHIFEPFYTTKEFGTGTGLGLATVFGAVKQNKGFIDVVSKPAQGTTFNIFLPRVTSTLVPMVQTIKKPISKGTETILLVEDDAMLLELITSMLEVSGYRVLAAQTSEQAKTLALEHLFEIKLLLTDVVMPCSSGAVLAVKLQSLCPQLKVIFMSGYPADIFTNREVNSEQIHFLQKPFSIKVLVAKVRDVLSVV